MAEGQVPLMVAHCLPIFVLHTSFPLKAQHSPFLYFQLQNLLNFFCPTSPVALSFLFHFIPRTFLFLATGVLQFCSHISPAFPPTMAGLVPPQLWLFCPSFISCDPTSILLLQPISLGFTSPIIQCYN